MSADLELVSKLVNERKNDYKDFFTKIKNKKLIYCKPFQPNLGFIKKLSSSQCQKYTEGDYQIVTYSEFGFEKLDFDISVIEKKTQELLIFKNETVLAIATFNVFRVTSIKSISLKKLITELAENPIEDEEMSQVLNQVLSSKFGKKVLFKGDRFVEFESLQVNPRYLGTKIWVLPINNFIEKFYKNNKHLVMLIHVFPLEYKSIVYAPNFPNTYKEKFNHRLLAMLSYYTNVLHSERVGSTEWLVRILNDQPVK